MNITSIYKMGVSTIIKLDIDGLSSLMNVLASPKFNVFNYRLSIANKVLDTIIMSIINDLYSEPRDITEEDIFHSINEAIGFKPSNIAMLNNDETKEMLRVMNMIKRDIADRVIVHGYDYICNHSMTCNIVNRNTVNIMIYNDKKKEYINDRRTE